MSKLEINQQSDTLVSSAEVLELRDKAIILFDRYQQQKESLSAMAALLLNCYERIRILESKLNDIQNAE